MSGPTKRGYFGIGVERISKAMNVGNLFRTAHAFDASFVFTVAANYKRSEGDKSDTSKGGEHMPFYAFPDPAQMMLPQGCKLVGIELIEGAIDLPSFYHPKQAAYILGPERGELSPDVLSRCDYTIKIPTSFCVNVGIAGAIVMYDRIQQLGRFHPRPMYEGGPQEALPSHRHGGPFSRTGLHPAMDGYRTTPPAGYNEGES